MLDLDYIEQTAYNIGYDRGLKAGRTQVMREIDEILHRRFSEMGLVLRSAEAEMAKTVRASRNDGDKERSDGYERNNSQNE